MKKIKSPIDYAYFKDVTKYQVQLAAGEEENLFNEYSRLQKTFKKILLESETARINLLKLVNLTKSNNKSIAKLHSKFDNNKSGHNKKIIDEMNIKLHNIEKTNPLKIVERLYEIGFSKETYNTVYNSSLPQISKDRAAALVKLKEEIKVIESKLTCSALKMAISIAQKYTSKIFNIDIKDAIQEATIGIFESINLYDPGYKSKNGNRIKFSTYANIKAEKRVKIKIMETSRLIKLPKSRLEVLFIVLKACTNLEEPNIETIVVKSNDILRKRKKRKLKPSEILSEERIVEAITLLNNNCIMLDSPLEGHSDVSGEIKTFNDIIADTQPTIEEETTLKDSKKELISLIKTHLDPVLWNVIVLRYLNDIPLSHEEVAEYLYVNNITKKKMSKEATRQKENNALKKLKIKDKHGVLRNLLKENIIERNRVENK